MGNKKIIFLIIVGIITVALIVGLLLLNIKKDKPVSGGNITIWINEWTTDDFKKLIEWFHNAHPENKNIQVNVEKKSTTTTSGYNTLLLTAIADKSGPDIFMLPKWEDANLESQIIPIPDWAVDIADFERRFDIAVADMVISSPTQDGKWITYSLLWVPLGYETLGVFYNRALMRSGVPKTWDEVENLYKLFPSGSFPTNLWLWKQFVPNIADILALFLADEEIYSYQKLENITQPFSSYYTFGDLSVATNAEADIYSQNDTLRRTEKLMSEAKPKSTTLDEFMKGNIGMVIGFQSLIFDLEKAQKRVWDANISWLVLTDQIPQFSHSKNKNIVKYNYLGISKNTTNPEASARFINYLTTPDAQRIAMEIYPYLLPAQKDFLPSVRGKIVSKEFPRAKLDAFVPVGGSEVKVFDYWFKETFKDIIEKKWDQFSSREGISTLWEEISKTISSQMTQYKK